MDTTICDLLEHIDEWWILEDLSSGADRLLYPAHPACRHWDHTFIDTISGINYMFWCLNSLDILKDLMICWLLVRRCHLGCCRGWLLRCDESFGLKSLTKCLRTWKFTQLSYIQCSCSPMWKAHSVHLVLPFPVQFVFGALQPNKTVVAVSHPNLCYQPEKCEPHVRRFYLFFARHLAAVDYRHCYDHRRLVPVAAVLSRPHWAYVHGRTKCLEFPDWRSYSVCLRDLYKLRLISVFCQRMLTFIDATNRVKHIEALLQLNVDRGGSIVSSVSFG